MKKKILLMIGIIVILLCVVIVFNIISNKKIGEKYVNNEYPEEAILLRMETMEVDNSHFLIIIDENYNNTANSKNNSLVMIKGYVGIDGVEKVTESKRISNKKYEQIKEKIENVDHYYEYIDSTCYVVTFRGEESYFVIVDEVGINIYK